MVVKSYRDEEQSLQRKRFSSTNELDEADKRDETKCFRDDVNEQE